MRVILGCLAIVAATLAVPTGEGISDAVPALGYHDAVGIPNAARIKEVEGKLFDEDSAILDPRIVGGVVAPSNAHPYLGGLVISFANVAGNSVCGSALLTASRLVTAAHCWWDGQKLANQFEVVLGSEWLFFGGTRIVTNQVVMHWGWNPATLVNDVAMIYLPWNVAFSAAVQPIPLPPTTQLWDTFVGEWGIASGYGKTSDAQTGVTTSTVVSQVALQVISVAQCQASFGTWTQESNVCTSGLGGVGICGGDSGGPLVVNRNGQDVLVGISSFVANAGCQLSHPSAFARVTSFYSFIVNHL